MPCPLVPKQAPVGISPADIPQEEADIAHLAKRVKTVYLVKSG